ncbi:hypothetical protein MELA_01541 [Candidatus Methylomirabilis lanthanidiphila]|uniref:Uncharacterized protein n=1 Tax=Candidatus Methylomirabilis lanthanidiphila TaxID=2211376 RepID=A0A564ZIL4_9BACT|nr:hypothetical protein [Candidatus Methylomirabilis lanthanidiphila]VUZ85165.1 hypothetical protein MELA_01541 [Candidatus Methylomirabilis lanthanidiphila]
MSRRPTGAAERRLCKMTRTAAGSLLMALLLAASVLPRQALAGNNELVILNSERWIDTLKGTVKNMSSDRAEEVVIVVQFFGEAVNQAVPRKRKAAPRQELGQQTVKLPPLDAGQEAPFEVDIAEQHRTAPSFKFEPHAIWSKRSGDRARKH